MMGGNLMDRMDRRGFLARTFMVLLSVLAAWPGSAVERREDSRGMEVGRTSRKRADHWRELAG